MDYARTTRRESRFARDERGNVAMLFALACLVIFPLVGFAIDFSRVVVDEHKLQMATDAAALAAAHDSFMEADERRAIIDAHLAHLEEELGRKITYELSQDSNGKILLVTHLTTQTTIAKVMGRDTVEVTARSAAVEGGSDIEVAMILDITGSMAGSRISALRTAAQDLVDIVVRDEQDPYYSKVAMVPYAVAVNVGPYAEAARGAIKPGIEISDAQWRGAGTKKITDITQSNPAVVTSKNHGFADGEEVYISGVKGMTELNKKTFTVINATNDTFELKGINSSSYKKYKKKGTAEQPCLTESCEVVVTAEEHGLSEGDHVVISGVKGMTQINTATNVTWQISNVTDDTFSLKGSDGKNYGDYTSGGTVYCTKTGCEYYRFDNAYSDSQRVFQVRQCATERTGAEAFTDASPTDYPVGLHYSRNSGDCPANQLIPLTNDKKLLSDSIKALNTAGSTAGHMGAAWGLYTLSPTFSDIFPAESRAAAYGRPKLHKFAVFMTDGEFNSSFCKNVLARGSNGSSSDQINCYAENGDSFSQAQKYCSAMKKEGIVVYTVGLQVSSSSLRTALTNCATSSQYAYFPKAPAELVDVFQQIGRAINEVRLVH
ncbi:ubiquitin-activating E1 FCCH domain-containing protein [Hyphomonas sp.]|uniref:ubiquitin-activating E1 FCCH domain-containing protein n=1 Tax=Hyphomonas sp. TaxID=87 RepID=UPI0025C20EF4|nr:ubiquitin-activating E1 FCCH domain-containing protein [Hyphomonas sp.]MBI1400485.1 pilus assembly protein TadG [Hyphomonas sp.]